MGWKRLRAGAGCALLAAMLVCPVMAGAEPAPAAAGCHDEGRGPHGDNAAAFTCCATTAAPASMQQRHDAGPATPAVAPTAAPAARRADRSVPRPLAPPVDPPLFLQHAALLI